MHRGLNSAAETCIYADNTDSLASLVYNVGK